MVTSVLLIRTNAYGELFNTRNAVEVVRSTFSAADVVALTTPQSEGKVLLEADIRLDGVLLFPPDGDAVKSPTAFRAFIRRQRFDAVVTCIGATHGMDYSRHLLSMLLCPGRKYLLDRSENVYPAFSLRGLASICHVLLTSARVRIGRRIAAGLVRAVKTLGVGGRCRSKDSEPGDAAPMLDLKREKIERLLWIRVDGIGDILMMLPALYALKAQFPRAQIDLLVRPLSAPLVKELPGIGQVYTFEPGDAPKSTRSHGKRQGLLSLALQLRKNRYDLALDAAGRDIARLLAFCSGARLRVSPDVSIYDDPAVGNLSFLMTDAVPLDVDKTRSAVANFLCLLENLGISLPKQPYQLPVSEGHRKSVAEKRRALGMTRPYAVIHARSAEDAKDWRAERFAAVAEHLLDRYDLDVLLTGTNRDQEYNSQIIAYARQGGRIFNAAGVFGLAEIPALCQQARVMVTVDTGPMHIAAMIGTPLVALFLPWFVRRDGPYGQADSTLIPFSGVTVPAECAADFWEGRLLDGIYVEDVVDAIDRKMKASSSLMSRAA